MSSHAAVGDYQDGSTSSWQYPGGSRKVVTVPCKTLSSKQPTSLRPARTADATPTSLWQQRGRGISLPMNCRTKVTKPRRAILRLGDRIIHRGDRSRPSSDRTAVPRSPTRTTAYRSARRPAHRTSPTRPPRRRPRPCLRFRRRSSRPNLRTRTRLRRQYTATTRARPLRSEATRDGGRSRCRRNTSTACTATSTRKNGTRRAKSERTNYRTGSVRKTTATRGR